MVDDHKRNRGFPSTHWSLLRQVKGDMSPDQRAVLDALIRRYWNPVYTYVRRCGHGRNDTEDLVQQFFSNWLAGGLFGRADQTRGRFRDYLLTSLRNFLANESRRKHAQRRWPKAGFVEQELDAHPGPDSPESDFFRAHTAAITREILHKLESECRQTGKLIHYEIFKARILLPNLEGAVPPPMRELAERFCITEKKVANYLLTARRAYRRLLETKVSEYAASPEDFAAEMQELSGHRRTEFTRPGGPVMQNSGDPGVGVIEKHAKDEQDPETRSE